VLDLVAQDTLLRPVLVPNEDPALVAAAHCHPEQQALQHDVRLLGHDLAILERAGLGLVGVADRVLRRRVLRGHELPLRARREARAAHPAEA
jgi:hypothetical protein